MPTTFSAIPIFCSNGNVGIQTPTPLTLLDAGGDMTVRGTLSVPNAVYQFLAGSDSASPSCTHSSMRLTFGKNYDGGTTGHLTSYEAVGVTNTEGSGWVSDTGHWHAPNAGKYVVTGVIYMQAYQGDTRWVLEVFDALSTLKYSHIVCVHPTTVSSASGVARDFQTLLNLSRGDHFSVRIETFPGGGTMTTAFNGTFYSHLKILQMR